MAKELNNKWATDVYNALNEAGYERKRGGTWSAENFDNLEALIKDVTYIGQVYQYLDNKGLINRGFCPYTNEKIDNTFPNYAYMGRKIYFSHNGYKQMQREDEENFEKVMGVPKSEMNPQPKKGCYIATVAYGNEFAPEVITLKRFRDEKLSKSLLGRLFINFYYFVSPTIAQKLNGNHQLNDFIRTKFLDKIVRKIK